MTDPRDPAGLTQREALVLRMVRRGADTSRRVGRPELVDLSLPGRKTLGTQEALIERLQALGFVGKNRSMVGLQITLAGEAALDRVPGVGRAKLPVGLSSLAKSKAMTKLIALRDEGFADPVDALLAIAYEVDEKGAWKHETSVRIQCLLGAAPFVRPKLQAILARVGDGKKSHAEWLDELKDEIYGDDDIGVIEGTAAKNGEDPEKN